MRTLGTLVVVGIAGKLLYDYFKKREADLKAKLDAALTDVKTEIKTVTERIYDDPNVDNWHN